ncbi:MAG: hypothetical protein QOJ03_68, partial [Frankiaceae bacterium]|nr:hypothetical protein [Frankiaceae bacterium]
VLRAIRAGRRQLRVLLVTDDDDLGVILRGLKLGADGACLSRAGPETLRLAIGNVIAGEVALPGDRVTEILHGLLEGNAEAQIETTSVLSLTDREHQVLRMLADGQGPAEIAVGLGLSISTVRTHLQHVMGKLGVHNQLHAAAKGRQLLGPSSPR